MARIDVTCRPIQGWRGEFTPEKRRRAGGFSAGWAETIKLLRREIGLLGGRSVVLGIAMGVDDLRGVDGWPRAGARVAHPGVQMFFDSKHGPLQYQCDLFRVWAGNARAIALTLERLRKAEMYGCTSRGEQYQGFIALPAPSAAFPTAEDAAEWIAERAGLAASDVVRDVDGAFKAVARKVHPDAGGNHADFTRLCQARDLLRRVG